MPPLIGKLTSVIRKLTERGVTEDAKGEDEEGQDERYHRDLPQPLLSPGHTFN